MSYETPPQAPFLNVFKGALVGPLSPVDGYVYLTKGVLGWNPETFPAIVVQATGAVTAVEVLGLDGETWCAYPGTDATIGSGEVKILRGRWTAIRLATADDVWVKGDLLDAAYNSGL